MREQPTWVGEVFTSAVLVSVLLYILYVIAGVL